MPRQVLGRPARRGEDPGDPGERGGLLREQREVRRAPADRLHEIERAPERHIRRDALARNGRAVARLGARLDEARHEQVEPLAARFRQLLVAGARAQRADAGERLARLDVTPGGKVALGRVAVERALPDRRRCVGLVGGGEHAVEMTRHRGAVAVELAGERLPVGRAHALGDELAVARGLGQRMGLRIVEILEPMLEATQEDICGGELRYGGLGELPARAERGQHLERGARAQARIAPAADQLEALRDELDLANAARPELDVAGEVAARDLLPDLRMELAHRVDRPEIEVLPEHERLRDLCELGTHPFVAPGDHARLDPRVPLPLAPLRDEVLLEPIEARRERSRVAPRAQPHVDPEHLAVGRHVGEGADDPLAELHEELVVRQPARGLALVRVGEHEIDVGGDVQLAAAELAHPDDQQVLGARRARRCAVLRFHPRPVRAERRVERDLGEVGHRAGDLRERRESREVARRDAQHHPCAQLAQRGAERRRVERIACRQERTHVGRAPPRNRAPHRPRRRVAGVRRAGAARSATSAAPREGSMGDRSGGINLWAE